jgi:hypothetical protein
MRSISNKGPGKKIGKKKRDIACQRSTHTMTVNIPGKRPGLSSFVFTFFFFTT